MVDYLAWSKADPLTAEQAARLWAEVDPSTPSYALTPAQSAAIAARLQMLAGKIMVGALKADTRANALAFIGRHETSLILRSELEALALILHERPAFLFPEEASKSGVTKPGAETGPNSDQPATEPPPSTSAFKGLFDGATKGPSASPPPIRIVPGARRISSAPPPPPYLRGTSGPPPTLAPRPASEKAPPSSATPVAATGEGRQTANSSLQDDVARLTREILERRDRGEVHDRDAMRLWVKSEVRCMPTADADALYYRVPEEIRKSRKQGRPPKQKSGRKR